QRCGERERARSAEENQWHAHLARESRAGRPWHLTGLEQAATTPGRAVRVFPRAATRRRKGRSRKRAARQRHLRIQRNRGARSTKSLYRAPNFLNLFARVRPEQNSSRSDVVAPPTP